MVMQQDAGERVFRAWVAWDPNDDENKHMPDQVAIPTKHNLTRAAIVRIIEAQLEATDNVFYHILTSRTGFGLRGISQDGLKWEKMYHTVACLRLEGVEVIEYCGKGEYHRMEIFFESPADKIRPAGAVWPNVQTAEAQL